jgi:hypothetical protein
VLGAPGQRELLAQPFCVPVVGLDIDRALEQKGLVETVELLLDCVGRSLGLRTDAWRAFQSPITDSFSSRM